MDELVIDIKTDPDDIEAGAQSIDVTQGTDTTKQDGSPTITDTDHSENAKTVTTDARQRPVRTASRRTRPSSSQPTTEVNGVVEKVLINGFEVEMNTIMDSHGWITIDSAKMPYVVRGAQKFIPLCVIEKTLLQPYPGPYLESELGRAPMMGFYLKTEEVRLLNRFVMQSYTQRLSLGRFSLKDMLVTLPDFIDFYQKVRSVTHIAPRVEPSPQTAPQPDIKGGWAQVNNTIVPYVLRNRVKMVPLSVVRYAAGLLSEVEVPSLNANQEECSYLNSACSEVGMEFEFHEDTRLLELFLVPTLSNSRVAINELPKKDPLNHARFLNRANDRRSVFVAASVRSQEISKDGGSSTGAKSKSPEINKKPDGIKPNKARRTPPRPPPPPVPQQPTSPQIPTGVHLIRVPISNQQPIFVSSPQQQQIVSPPQPPIMMTATQPPTMVTPTQPPTMVTATQQAAPAPQLVQMPVSGLKICPQHGIRGVMMPGQPGQSGGQQPMILQPPPATVGSPPVTMVRPAAPLMVLRLENPLPSNTQIVMGRPMPGNAQVIQINGPLPSNAQVIRLAAPGLPATSGGLHAAGAPGGGLHPIVLSPTMLSQIRPAAEVVPTNAGLNTAPTVIKIESDDDDDDNGEHVDNGHDALSAAPTGTEHVVDCSPVQGENAPCLPAIKTEGNMEDQAVFGNNNDTLDNEHVSEETPQLMPSTVKTESVDVSLTGDREISNHPTSDEIVPSNTLPVETQEETAPDFVESVPSLTENTSRENGHDEIPDAPPNGIETSKPDDDVIQELEVSPPKRPRRRVKPMH